ncbi:PhzF family phenazine biosynthesis protein [Klebsiella sp. RHBSTW-00484]|uniref:PhzF family phenazine biosynthesis protein n=1 Tax=unclassified Klebsiella TaxID=2608929 RepID=UPI0015E5989A|nr:MULTISPECIES: PhzF family phenazine biosynthesis protein [unclassified Klebsiella]MBA7847271.1 PhzF family phenazine biosynthesis protein [Klebsiella sp. RHBSTW-00465]QLO36843.1 PhzF family phenazine biosynthesis protein [Klebsiella sp. RHBSTW-00484]QLT76361.1 PhzF family phenazine biosynthesis protein [Klebsiella sp. RHBSTW-00464]
MTEVPVYLVAAFSKQPFAGNPAAVCLLDEWLPDELLLKMAQQHNQSETAFVVRESDGFALRWFTTRNEVNLCGHATLASAHVIFHHLDFPDAVIHFATASGLLTVSRDGDWLTLDFPAGETEECEPPADMLSALGIDSYLHARKGRAWLIELASREQVAAVRPNISSMIPGEHKVTITAVGDGNYDFVSRFFSPGEAVWEDPVTGSAHTMLIPYWSVKLGKTQMLARQISARGGDIRCELQGERVLMSGQAVSYLSGAIMLR